MKGPVNETEKGQPWEGKELREYSVLEAKKKKRNQNKTASSRKMQSTVSTVEK